MADSDPAGWETIRAPATEPLLISPLSESLVPECLEVLFQAFMMAPLDTALFGAGDRGLLRKKRAMHLAWKAMLGETCVATTDGRVVGVLHSVRHPQGLLSKWQVLCLVPELLWVTGPCLLRAVRWRLAWRRAHPRKAHSHLGPVAVSPEFQGRGVGTEMLKNYCSVLDRSGEASYLETDNSENVRLYRRFGFAVVDEFPVLGVPNWFMLRSPRQVE